MSVRGKFRLTHRTEQNWGPGHGTYPVVLKFQAVGDDGIPENQRYHKYTPSGTLEITIDNPPAADFFELGKEYYLDFTKA